MPRGSSTSRAPFILQTPSWPRNDGERCSQPSTKAVYGERQGGSEFWATPTTRCCCVARPPDRASSTTNSIDRRPRYATSLPSSQRRIAGLIGRLSDLIRAFDVARKGRPSSGGSWSRLLDRNDIEAAKSNVDRDRHVRCRWRPDAERVGRLSQDPTRHRSEARGPNEPSLNADEQPLGGSTAPLSFSAPREQRGARRPLQAPRFSAAKRTKGAPISLVVARCTCDPAHPGHQPRTARAGSGRTPGDRAVAGAPRGRMSAVM